MDGSSTLSMESLLSHPGTLGRTEMMKFLRNAALLCLKIFPRNYKIEEAILIAEEQSFGGINTSQRATPSQALAKLLLKCDRQVLLLFNNFMFYWLFQLPKYFGGNNLSRGTCNKNTHVVNYIASLCKIKDEYIILYAYFFTKN